MRLEYKNNFLDILCFNAVHQLLSPVLQGLCLSITSLIFWNELNYNEVTHAALTAFLWYCGLWISQLLLNVLYLFSRKNKSILTTHLVEIQDDAFFEETKFNRSFFFWPGVLKAVSRPGFVAIYVGPHMAHVIPNRFFSSKAQRADFLALAREKIRASACQV